MAQTSSIAEIQSLLTKLQYDASEIPQDAGPFVDFLRKAFADPHSSEMKQLYNDLFKHFAAADVHMTGTVDRINFDALIENSARLVRELKIAPSTDVMYNNNVQEKYQKRSIMFSSMDANHSNAITWDEYLNFTKIHIKEKLEQLTEAGVGALGAQA